MSDLKVVQIALTTRDLPATLRFYAEVFGFSNAGGIPIWGEPMRLQGLEPSARAMMWWMVDGQPFFQLEIFSHSSPYPQPKPDTWLPSDLGWVRFGVAVPDLSITKTALARWSVRALGEMQDRDGTRRMTFTDPTTSALVEVIEQPGRERPQACYATYSTNDLDQSRAFYRDRLGLPVGPRRALHAPQHEGLWGLMGAELDGFLVQTSGVQIEVVHYRSPKGRTKPDHATISDLGIMNVALGARSDAPVRAAIASAQASGLRTTPLFGHSGSVVTYLTDLGSEIELIAVPDDAAAQWGFHATAPFLAVG